MKRLLLTALLLLAGCKSGPAVVMRYVGTVTDELGYHQILIRTYCLDPLDRDREVHGHVLEVPDAVGAWSMESLINDDDPTAEEITVYPGNSGRYTVEAVCTFEGIGPEGEDVEFPEHGTISFWFDDSNNPEVVDGHVQ